MLDSNSNSNSNSDLLAQCDEILKRKVGHGSKREILKETLHFLQREQYNTDIDALSEFLKNDPPTEPVRAILPLDGLTERLELIANVEPQLRRNENHDRKLDRKNFAALLIAPLEVLQRATAADSAYFLALLSALEELPSLIYQFLAKDGQTQNDAKPQPKSQSVKSQSAKSRSAKSQPAKSQPAKSPLVPQKRKSLDDAPCSNLPTDKKGKTIRNEERVLSRKELDGGRCIVTGAIEPNTCHILPNATCFREGAILNFRTALEMTARLFHEKPETFTETRERAMMLTSDVGVSDQNWNMICLSPLLHRWWGMGYFGFKYLGMVSICDGKYQQLTLQFHWMPRALPGKDVELDEEYLMHHLDKNTWGPWCGVAAFRLTSRPVKTGDIFKVSVATEGAHKMKAAFDLQWALIRIVALSGAADIDDKPGTDDTGSPQAEEAETEAEVVPMNVESWLDAVATDDDGGNNSDNDDGHSDIGKLPLSIGIRGSLERQVEGVPASIVGLSGPSVMKGNQAPTRARDGTIPGSTMDEQHESSWEPATRLFGNRPPT
ncbi:hypothetical protein B0T14DRAFT_498047 [Immersiella caudata]|uniref:HNH nuclease domain-containing protein n=1 Tax=Immersiella caudata TaxID=314043 RepID=A0AA39WK66_9PEZI|nr:hypothetical protein B0T14DRAFT_498047 [Immersiella caudata]